WVADADVAGQEGRVAVRVERQHVGVQPAVVEGEVRGIEVRGVAGRQSPVALIAGHVGLQQDHAGRGGRAGGTRDLEETVEHFERLAGRGRPYSPRARKTHTALGPEGTAILRRGRDRAGERDGPQQQQLSHVRPPPVRWVRGAAAARAVAARGGRPIDSLKVWRGRGSFPLAAEVFSSYRVASAWVRTSSP